MDNDYFNPTPRLERGAFRTFVLFTFEGLTKIS
jgi:hypothetical protein